METVASILSNLRAGRYDLAARQCAEYLASNGGNPPEAWSRFGDRVRIVAVDTDGEYLATLLHSGESDPVPYSDPSDAEYLLDTLLGLAIA